jgi:hypothetical protein
MLRFAVVAAVVLQLAAPAAVLAKPKPIDFSHACGCICETEYGIDSNIYRSKLPVDCQAYVGKTCNIDQGGGKVRSGKVTFCSAVDDAASAAGTLPSFTPAMPADTIDPGQGGSYSRTVPGVVPQLMTQ